MAKGSISPVCSRVSTSAFLSSRSATAWGQFSLAQARAAASSVTVAHAGLARYPRVPFDRRIDSRPVRPAAISLRAQYAAK